MSWADLIERINQAKNGHQQTRTSLSNARSNRAGAIASTENFTPSVEDFESDTQETIEDERANLARLEGALREIDQGVADMVNDIENAATSAKARLMNQLQEAEGGRRAEIETEIAMLEVEKADKIEEFLARADAEKNGMIQRFKEGDERWFSNG